MKISPYLTQRPHLYLTILMVIIAFLLLTLAAAKIFSDEASPGDTSPIPPETHQPAESP